MLRPDNLIHPYRLEGKVVPEASCGRSIFDFWKPLLTDVLIDSVKADDGVLLHLSTEEYQHIFDWKRILNEVTVVQPLFKVFDGTRLKNITVYAKSCRGAMARYVLQNKITDPKRLIGFEYEGLLSLPNHHYQIIFLKELPSCSGHYLRYCRARGSLYSWKLAVLILLSPKGL